MAHNVRRAGQISEQAAPFAAITALLLVGPHAACGQSVHAELREQELEAVRIEEIESLLNDPQMIARWDWGSDEDRLVALREIVESDVAALAQQDPGLSLLVLHQTKQKIILDTDELYLQHVGSYVESPTLRDRAAEISDALKLVIRVGSNLDRSDVDSIALSRTAAVLDEAAWALVAEVEGKAWPERWTADNASETPDAVIKQFLLGQVHRFLNAAEAADEARYHKERIMPLSALDSIKTSAHSVVAILQEKPSGRRRHIGTGFIYRGHVVTAAHVLTQNEFWPTGFGPDKPSDFSSLRVLHVNENADSFDVDAVVPLKTNFVQLWPELDVAAMRIGEPEHSQTRAALQAAATVPVSFEPNEDDSKIGIVYGLTSVEPSSDDPQPMWIPPGRIIFPSEVFRPSHALQRDGGDLYFRAVRAEVFGTSALSCTDTQLAQIALRVWKRYSVCKTAVQCRLAGDYGHSRSKLSSIAGESLESLPCFGTDLVTEPAASGSPIFRLDGESQILIGVHLGVAGPTSGNPTRTSLANYGRVAPFILAKEKIDAWIQYQDE